MHRSRRVEPEFARSAGRASGESCPAGFWSLLCRKLYRWRKAHLIRRALRQAGEPSLILDLSHAVGSFWALLAEHGNRVILAAVPAAESLERVQAAQPVEVAARVRVFEGSAEAIHLPDNAIDCVFAMGLLPQTFTAEQRLAILSELRRVSRDTLILSLQVDGRCRARGSAISRATLEEEMSRVGVYMVGRYGLLPGYSPMWIYVLRKED